MDHLDGMDLVPFAEAFAEVASADVGPPVRRTTPVTSQAKETRVKPLPRSRS
jgi:hypothetical protein